MSDAAPDSKYAPIVLPTYSRLEHLRQTIEALQRNTLAPASDLFLFSDAPRPGDEPIVAQVREYLHSVTGFNSVTVVEQRVNDHLANTEGAMQRVLDSHGRLIFMEDDIVTAPGFLTFVNQGLDFYRDCREVFSICAYAPPLDIQLSGDSYGVPRVSAWGMGIWRDRFMQVTEVSLDDIFALGRKRLSRCGEDIPWMAYQQARHRLNAWDVRAMVLQSRTDAQTIFPVRSLVQNIGHDGTGVHCGVSDRFEHDSLWGKCDGFSFEPVVQLNETAMGAVRRFRKPDLSSRLWIRAVYLPLGRLAAYRQFIACLERVAGWLNRWRRARKHPS
ncbi:MAG: sugar transferase [Pseudomonadota bacterium]